MANRNDDIVKRLRDHCYECQDEAANEIERLRKENEDMRAIVSLQGEVVRMAQRRHEERDEARQIACKNEAELNRMMFDNPKYADPAAIAAQRGWDCFDRPYRETTFNGDPPNE